MYPMLRIERILLLLILDYVLNSVVANSLQPHACSLPGFPVHRIFQARILDWVAISFSILDYSSTLFQQTYQRAHLFHARHWVECPKRMPREK